jgi:hypothetical protein
MCCGAHSMGVCLVAPACPLKRPSTFQVAASPADREPHSSHMSDTQMLEASQICVCVTSVVPLSMSWSRWLTHPLLLPELLSAARALPAATGALPQSRRQWLAGHLQSNGELNLTKRSLMAILLCL